MKLVPRADWDPSLCEAAGTARWPLGEPLAQLGACPTWPSVARIGEVLAACGVTNVAGTPLRTELQPPKPRRAAPGALRRRDELYDARIDGEGVLPTRARSYHDLFNALVWASFPRTKAAISARQHAIWRRTLPQTFHRLPSARTREQDALAMLDEGGLVLVTSPEQEAEVASLVADGALDVLEARAREGTLAGVIVGHAVYEHFVSASGPVRAATVVLSLRAPLAEPGLVGRVDAALAAQVNDPARFCAPPTAAGIPVRAHSPLVVLPADALRRVCAVHRTRRMTHELTIDGMSCGHCVKTVREALAKVPGVTRADVELDPDKVGHARVEGDVERALLIAAVEAEDYRVRPA